MSSFRDLLNQAGNLNTKIGAGAQKDLSTQKPAANEHDLRSIFRASDEIWQRKQLRSDLQWKPRNAVTGALSKPAALSESQKPIEPVAPLDQSSSRVFDEYTKRSAERAKVEAERAFINQHILEQSHYGGLGNGSNKQKQEISGPNNSTTSPNKIPSGIVENDQDNSAMDLLASHVSRLVSKSPTLTIESAVREFLRESGGTESNKLWRKVFALCEKRHAIERTSVADFRNSDQWKQYVIEEATTLLQQTFKDHMEAVIENNLQIAQRGGIPSNASLVEAYLNVRLNKQFQYQDGQYGKHPIWPVLFLCLRIGDFGTAAKVAGNLQNLSNCSILVKILSDFNSNLLLDGDKRFRLNAEWKHVASSCPDPYKRAVYGMILGGDDVPEVNDNIENWLWSRLMNCKLDPVNGIGHFYKLQSTICVDYGEEYFLGGKGNYTIYFTVLWLTGQIERAIDLLFRSDQILHAVHIAILAYQQKLLNISTYSSAPILSYDSKDPIYCHLNFSRLLLLYVKNFETVNLEYTLAYCYFLHSIEFENDAGLEGGNIFEACISRLCFISEKVDLILGRMSETGDRVPGLIDRFSSTIEVRSVIARVAKDFDVSGDSLTACRLYILSGRPNEALQICSKRLGTYLTTLGANRTGMIKEMNDTISLASWLETRYKQRPEPGLQESYLAELSTLIKLNVFYSAVHSEPTEAFSIMKSMKLLPLSNDELSSRVSNYSDLPEQVRSVLPDVIMALMETLYNLYKDPNSPPSKRGYYQACSNVLLLYVAQVGLRFPVHINSKFLKLQSQIN